MPSDPRRRKRIKRGQHVAFTLTRHERDLIVERTFVDAEIEGRLRNARASGSDLIVELTLDDVDDLAGHVAAQANHCSEVRVRRVLEAVYDRLANIEDTFTGDDDEAAVAVTHEAKALTPKQGQYLAFIYYYTKIHGRAGRSGSSPVFPRHAACRAPDDQDAGGARIHRSRTGSRTLDQAATDASAVAGPRIGSRSRGIRMDEFSDIWIEQCDAARDIRDAWGTEKALGYLVGEKLLNYLRASDSRSDWAEKIPLFTEEIKRIFTVDELNRYFATTTRVGCAAHVATDEEYELMRDAGMFGDDVVSGAADAILFERARALLLGEARGSQ